MKKLTFLFMLSLLISSCTQNDVTSSDITEPSSTESITYSFNDNDYIVNYILDEETDELIPIESEELNFIEKIIQENNNSIEYQINEERIIIFEDDAQMNLYLDSQGISLQANKGTTNISAASNIFVAGNLELYFDCCYDDRFRFDWVTRCASFINGDGQEQTRLRDFTSSAWASSLLASGQGPVICGQDRVLGSFTNRTNPDNIMNSVLVRNVFARFYEDINFGGRSIVLDARNGQTRGFRKLRKVRNGLFGRNWRNRISSIRLTN